MGRQPKFCRPKWQEMQCAASFSGYGGFSSHEISLDSSLVGANGPHLTGVKLGAFDVVLISSKIYSLLCMLFKVGRKPLISTGASTVAIECSKVGGQVFTNTAAPDDITGAHQEQRSFSGCPRSTQSSDQARPFRINGGGCQLTSPIFALSSWG